MSVFKNIDTFEGHYVHIGADILTSLMPAFGPPSGTNKSDGSLISSTRSLGALPRIVSPWHQCMVNPRTVNTGHQSMASRCWLDLNGC